MFNRWQRRSYGQSPAILLGKRSSPSPENNHPPSPASPKRHHGLPPSTECKQSLPTRWLTTGTQLGAELRAIADQRLRALTIRPREELGQPLDYAKGTKCEGDERLRLVRYYLNNNGLTRSKDQREMHRHMLIACLPKIYGADWDANSVRVLKEFGVKELETAVVGIAARRVGKTWGVMMMLVAVAAAVPGYKWLIFATQKRTSGTLLDDCVKLLKKMGLGGRIIKHIAGTELYLSPVDLDQSTMSNLRRRDLLTHASTSRIVSFPGGTLGMSVPLLCRIALHIVMRWNDNN